MRDTQQDNAFLDFALSCTVYSKIFLHKSESSVEGSGISATVGQ